MMKHKHLITIVGPTAVGKTPVAVALAKHFNTGIIGADSRQLYREMKIGTAMPSAEQLESVPHYFIGNRSVQDYYNASLFESEVLELLTGLFRRHDIMIMAGGSGLYVDAVCNGIDDFPTVNALVREKIKSDFQQKGVDWLRSEVKESDPFYFSQVDPDNPKRLLKALEIFTMTGRPYSSFLTRQKKERDFRIIQIGLNMERNKLYDNINRRVEAMIREGLVDEVKSLLPFRKLNALNTVGYKEIFDHLGGKVTLAEAIDLIKRHSRQYARRQLTWFRKNKNIRWFTPDEQDDLIKFVSEKVEVESQVNGNR